MINKIFKHTKDKTRFLYMHPIALMIMFDMYNWCIENNVEFQVTSTVSTKEEDEKYNRRSTTHRTGRAFDLSIKSFSFQELNSFRHWFNKKYYKEAAISPFNSQPTLIVVHDNGNGKHAHVQIHSKYSREIKIAMRKMKE